ncbi:hypothetical protein F5148DRAFT_1152204 [Russula earlei]|uniref:Uncharacterized protein n=1 Tax=Russula earlei TaxID=71964 RepID=A0ACC0TZH9_9AGAM|nr:hypothetical protein F5148DRAFT_1152204 [Russula earlei]
MASTPVMMMQPSRREVPGASHSNVPAIRDFLVAHAFASCDWHHSQDPLEPRPVPSSTVSLTQRHFTCASAQLSKTSKAWEESDLARVIFRANAAISSMIALTTEAIHNMAMYKTLADTIIDALNDSGMVKHAGFEKKGARRAWWQMLLPIDMAWPGHGDDAAPSPPAPLSATRDISGADDHVTVSGNHNAMAMTTTATTEWHHEFSHAQSFSLYHVGQHLQPTPERRVQTVQTFKFPHISIDPSHLSTGFNPSGKKQGLSRMRDLHALSFSSDMAAHPECLRKWDTSTAGTTVKTPEDQMRRHPECLWAHVHNTGAFIVSLPLFYKMQQHYLHHSQDSQGRSSPNSHENLCNHKLAVRQFHLSEE